MSRKGKKLNKTFVVVLVLVLMIPLLQLWLAKSFFDDMSDTSYKYEKTSHSPTREYSVTVWQSQAVWSFGPSKVKVEANWSGAQQIYETELSDDGGQGTITIRWLNDCTAQVTLHGSEQKDEIILIEFGDGIVITSNQS